MLLHDDLNWYKSRHRIKSHGHDKFKHPPGSPVDPSGSNHAFDIVSFNLLAPVYKRLNTKSANTGRRHREAGDYNLWCERLESTMDFFKQEIYKDAAIIALQEYWLDPRYRRIFEEQFQQNGYECRVMQRTGSKADAVALAIKSEVFEIRGVENINLCTFGDRVALLLWLRHRSTGFDLLVANTHLSFPHNVLDRMNQVAQMKHLTGVIDTFAHTHRIEQAPALIMGDFNVEGHSPVCDHLRSVGYYSAFEISPPVNTHHTGTAVVTAREETDEFLTVATHETCVLPNPHDPENQPEGQASQRGASDCDDVGDNCVVDNSANNGDATAPTIAPTSAVEPFAAKQKIKADLSSRGTNTTHNTTHGVHARRSTGKTEPTPARVSYVSHFNHRDEQVGVDHIFLRPVPNKRPEDESDAWEVVPACVPVTIPAGTHTERNSGSADAASNDNSNSSGKGNPSSDAQDTSSSSSPRSSVVDKLNIFVAECQVLPKHVGCAAWYPSFIISDHRPVRAKLIFTQKEPPHSAGK
jgi:hypothetical protein